MNKKTSASITDSALAVGTIPVASGAAGALINSIRAGQGNRMEGALRGASTGMVAGMGGTVGLVGGGVVGGISGANLGTLIDRLFKSKKRIGERAGGVAGAVMGGVGGAHVLGTGLARMNQATMGPASYDKKSPAKSKPEDKEEESKEAMFRYVRKVAAMKESGLKGQLLKLVSQGFGGSRKFVNDHMLGQKAFRDLRGSRRDVADYSHSGAMESVVPFDTARNTAFKTMATGAGIGSAGTATGFLADDVGGYVKNKATGLAEWLSQKQLSPEEQMKLTQSNLNASNAVNDQLRAETGEMDAVRRFFGKGASEKTSLDIACRQILAKQRSSKTSKTTSVGEIKTAGVMSTLTRLIQPAKATQMRRIVQRMQEHIKNNTRQEFKSFIAGPHGTGYDTLTPGSPPVVRIVNRTDRAASLRNDRWRNKGITEGSDLSKLQNLPQFGRKTQ